MPKPEVLHPHFTPVLSKRVPKRELDKVRNYVFPDVATPGPTLHEDTRAAFWLSGVTNSYGEHAVITLGQKFQRGASISCYWYSGFVPVVELNNPDLHPIQSVRPLEAFILNRTIFGPFDRPERAIQLII